MTRRYEHCDLVTAVTGGVTTAKRRAPIFIVRLQPRPGVDPIRALRAGLKALGRRFGLRAIEVKQEGHQEGR
jgi:hypothetical protein